MRKTTLIVGLTLMTFGCSSLPSSPDTSTLAGLQQLVQNPTESKKVEDGGLSIIRRMALQETALSVGAQGGLAWRAAQINRHLEAQATELDHAFNFNLLLLDHTVLPPVLERGDSSLNLADEETLRIVDRTYTIVDQAHFVTTPPTWRTYLIMNYDKPSPPDTTLLPRNAEEQAVWRQYTAEGWQNGIDQANSIYESNLSLLKRDFEGMLLYRNLLAQHMVTPPFVAKTNLGITGDESNLRINDQILRITALPQLQQNSKLWNPVLPP